MISLLIQRVAGVHENPGVSEQADAFPEPWTNKKSELKIGEKTLNFQLFLQQAVAKNWHLVQYQETNFAVI